MYLNFLKVWKYEIVDSISSFCLDPFDAQQLLVCTDSYMVYQAIKYYLHALMLLCECE